MANIPKVIHQTWRDNDVPEHFDILSATWKENHVNWKYVLWTDKMNRDFIEDRYPEFISRYDAYPHNIQRVDAVRYFILYEFGGLFVDMDFECLMNIEPLLNDGDCVFGLEPSEHCDRFSKKAIICNAFMACAPKNDFLGSICKELVNGVSVERRDGTPVWREILESTGPFMLTDLYRMYAHKERIKLLPSSTIYPLSLGEARGIVTGKLAINEDMQAKIDDAYAVHYFFGTWW